MGTIFSSRGTIVRAKIFTTVFASLLLVACSNDESGTATTSANLATTLASLPATIEGELSADVEEGDVGEDGISEITFGTIAVGEENVDVVIAADVLKSVALPDNVGKVRATLGSVTNEYGGFPYYRVTRLERL